MVDLTMCPASANETADAGGQNASMAGNATTNANNATSPSNGTSLGDVTVTGSGVNMSFIPNSRLEVFPVTINYQFFPVRG
jgi:hypothetical protein